MSEDLGRDLDVSNSVLNYLHACYQGQFACLNILSQVGYHEFNPDDLTSCQDNIAFAEAAIAKLQKGLPTLSMMWKSPQTSEAKEVMSRVAKVKTEIQNLATTVERLLIDKSSFDNQENVKFLLGSYARIAYTNEHYIRGFIEYGKSFTLPEVVQAYEALLPQAAQSIESAHLFFDVYTGEEQIPDVFYQSLFEECLFLPGMLRTVVHDLNKLLSIYRGPLDFDQLEIPAPQAEEWRVIGVDPNIAGYWHAFNLTANDYVSWMQIGINTPRLVWFWACLQFDSAEAAPWVDRGFSPPLARQWLMSNFTPDEAVDHIQRGFTNPATAREEGKKIIDE